MSPHTFLQDGTISEADLKELIRLTEAGQLEWRPLRKHYGYYAKSRYHETLRQAGLHLKSVHILYNRGSHTLHYVKIRSLSHQGEIDYRSASRLLNFANRLHELAQRAADHTHRMSVSPS
jgi:hypothetical protein